MFSPHNPRADSKLKTLPRERQTEIADFARTHSLAETVQWLRQAGLSTSISAVSQFLRWCRLRQQAEQGESELRAAIADLARSDSISTADRLRHVGNIFFAGAAPGGPGVRRSRRHLRNLQTTNDKFPAIQLFQPSAASGSPLQQYFFATLHPSD